MFVIEVMPLHPGVRLDTLSYFGSDEYQVGTLVTVPIRNGTARALVMRTEEVSAAKTALRAATFSLRKLPPQERTDHLSPALIRTAEMLSLRYAAPMGVILYSLLPPIIQSGEIPLPHTHHIEPKEIHLPEVLVANRGERYRVYRSLVRETFAHAGSLLLIAPTSVEAESLRDVLKSGIEERVILLTSTLGKRALKEAYAALDDFSRPKLIIATPTHAIIERHDITHVILEHARSSAYKEHRRPYLDIREAARIHARETGRRLIISDLLVRTEDEAARREERYLTFGESPKRIELQGKLETVILKRKDDTPAAFALFSSEVINAIKEVRKKKGRIFIFAARRGLAPIVACSDCGHIFRSPQSGAPYSLVRTMKKGVEERWFVCSTSGQRERAADTCPECGSWRLRERGIGIQYAYDEFRKLFPEVPVTLFDHTSASTYKKACFLRDTFYGTKGAVMLGTSMAVSYLEKPVDLSVVINMDALLATPTWRLEEENLGLLLALREATKGRVLVQTRSSEHPMLNHARHATVEHFYTEELELRKNLDYPPFTTFIHLTWQGDEATVRAIEREVSEVLKLVKVSIYPSPTPPRGSIILYGLIRVNVKDWPDQSLREALLRLPPSVRVVIDPDRIV
jgi:primosomal protein N' (replication factor Y)